ncbi:MAG: glycosyltransferase family 1 protein [Caulobacteraceae bacterium]|nr:glycosyltransferase family 1 protein [Caulobacteraceae bacterium]
MDELRPDLILLHFADRISNVSLEEARRLAPGAVIADINIDPIDSAKNRRRLALRRGAVDALFVTTADEGLREYAGPGAFAAFLPNPVDRSIETVKMFEVERPEADILYAASDDGPRELGGERVTPARAVARLAAQAPGARWLTPGIGGVPPARGAAYLEALSSARMGWSLSRRASLPLYASDRMAHLMGNGLATLIDARAGFERFYGPDEAVFYREVDDLGAAVRGLLADDARARAVAEAGWRRTWALFDSGRVYTYLVDQLFKHGGARGYEWPCDRWG